MTTREDAASAYPELAKVAPRLNRKRGWWIPLPPMADMLGGCVYRRDEVIMEIEVINALRPVLRYRTMLLRGEPEEEYRGHWEAAQLLFPRWVGFRPRRMRWTRWCESAFRYMEGETRRLLRHADAFDRAERVAEIRARITELAEAGGADDEAEAP